MTKSAEEIAAGLTKAQRRMIVNGSIGYCDDNTMDAPGRRMMYRLIEQGLLAHSEGMSGPDVVLTPLGLEVRSILLRDQEKGEDR